MKVLILDAYNLLYRARFAAQRGAPPGPHSITYVFFRSLRPIIEKFEPDVAYFVLEGTPVYRLDIQPDYKGTRDKTVDEGFNAQRDEIISIITDSFPINTIYHPKHEADDIIASLVKHRHTTDDVTVVSSDTDFIQLLDEYDNVDLYNPVTKKYREGVGCNYVKWKALRGDGADNIVGFTGIGGKRAKTLVENFEKLEKFMANDTEKWEKYERNQQMIGFLYPELDGISEWVGSGDWSALRKKFTEFRFFSITNDTSWGKFVNTFNSLGEN